MHVAVIGAGVIGVTTAYYLAQRGHEVTVVDRHDDVASGASNANGGQLSYTFTDAFAKPEFVAKIPRLLAGRDVGSRVRMDTALLPWGLRFLAQCTRKKARENTLAVLETALRSAALLAELQNSVPIDFAHREAGKLVLLSDAEQLEAARQSTALKQPHGSDATVVSTAEAIRIEPALGDLAEPFLAAVYSPSDAVADSRRFATGLGDWLQRHREVRFLMGRNVVRIVAVAGRCRSLQFDNDELAVDAAVVCTGAWSDRLLRPLGIRPHVYPMRGYSVTLPPGDAAPSVSVTALRHRTVFSRLGESIRIAGFADFGGFDIENDGARIDTLVQLAKQFAPRAADYAAAEQQRWGGFRPMTPSGQPRVGATRIGGVYLNIGHGMLGWTLACATAHDVSQQLSDGPG